MEIYQHGQTFIAEAFDVLQVALVILNKVATHTDASWK